MLLSAFRENLIKQSEGVPIFVGDAIFYIRRWGTPESQDFVKELRKKLFGPIHQDATGDEYLLIGHWLAEYGCVGWQGVLKETASEDVQFEWYEIFEKFRHAFLKKENVDYPKTEHLPYSKSAARNIFTNPEYFASLNNILLSSAMNFENYLYDDAVKDLEAIKKN